MKSVFNSFFMKGAVSAALILVAGGASAQNLVKKHTYQEYYSVKTSDGDRAAGWAGTIAKGAGAVWLSIAQVNSIYELSTETYLNWIKDNSIATQDLQNLNKGILTINPNDGKYKYLWDNNLAPDLEMITGLEAQATSAKSALEAAEKAMGESSKTPIGQSLILSTGNGNQPYIFDGSKTAVTELRVKYNEAAQAVANAKRDLAQKKIDVFNPTATEVYDLPAAARIRAKVKMTMEQDLAQMQRTYKVRWAEGGARAAGAALGIFLIADSIYGIAILCSDRSPGVLPLIFHTNEPREHVSSTAEATRSCSEKVAEEWNGLSPNDLNYLCTARGNVTADSNPDYTTCLVDLAHSGLRDGDIATKQCARQKLHIEL